MASDPSYPLFPIFAFCGFVLAIVPLPWHLEALNSATCYYMIWASLACLNKFVNSLVWANNALDSAPIWCDVSTRIIIGASVGIPAASLCINRRLYLIARMGATTVTKAEKRRAILVDTLICVLFPIICMAFAFIVQGHRFNIYEEIGCYPDIYNTIAAYFLVNWWPVVLGLISACYCVLSLRSFYLRRAQFREFLSSSKTSLTFGRYFRLMALATTELLFTIPISGYAIYLNATTLSMEPWISWSYVHYQFSRVEQVPSVVWRSDRSLVVALELGQWLNPLCALIFFAYFGIAEEARRHYKEAFWFIACRLGYSQRSRNSTGKHLLRFAIPHCTPSSLTDGAM
ncbi:fungal pheromone STE3G-protein-coupled receptor [Fomitopsis serialis]|uniref:fungal pheromone STE3G-protein-coupled receptor n=1 Tax=Fomitopsis serialis TaxID=139415 RepID=UPI00200812D1|nr:fungal pheromone STE3G-protein-coupled receptor [Neoantrodia serialis]KAH9911223.1 fungal pheromone STE3G-protein-coupled receptor [Neoantrodia serialis]